MVSHHGADIMQAASPLFMRMSAWLHGLHRVF